ncbi:MAG: response regulator [Xenococcaceae cyanobacterium MO_188.B32]|nr:response regulator [Xenococcaceae cyanobacterium MO_188.B32]
MSEDKELQIRLQFLEEAQEYLDNIESRLLGLGSGNVNSQQMDSVLRDAHSIKGGAAMMGFEELSDLAHRLEDFFKVLKIGKTEVINDSLESLLLESVKSLRQIASYNRQQVDIDRQWLDSSVSPIFDRLHQLLGEPNPEDEAALLSADMGEDMSTLIFETEVEESLQQLESHLANFEPTTLREYLLTTATELSGLGEILELPAFSSLCQSVIEHLETNPEQLEEIAQAALQEWRRSQALVLIGQTDVLATSLDLTNTESTDFELAKDNNFEAAKFDEIADYDSIASFVPPENLDIDLDIEEASNIFAAFEDATADLLEESGSQELTTSTDDADLVSTQKLPTPVISTPETVVNNSTTDNTIRVSVQQLEELSDYFGEISIERNGLNLRLHSLRNLVNLLSQRIKNLEHSNFQLRIAYDKVGTEAIGVKSRGAFATQATHTTFNPSILNSKPEYFDSLEMDSYSDIHLLSQEVMETVVQIQEVTKDIEINLEETERNAKGLNRTTKQMQTTITKVRMRPLSDLVSRFPLALRNMEMQYGKKVQLKVRGGSTLIDRSILEVLNDPLLHLFRNAFDHGIEDRETRLQAGKSEQGLITISASYRGNQTVITLSDDGGGINLDKIKARAVTIGISEEELAKAQKNDLLDLIFEPGFSTADRVTDLSGRGVGMDVVRTNIEQVKGKIQVDTEPGIGTTFTISVPFTLSVIRVLLVESNDMLLAFPTNIIEEMLVLEPDLILESVGSEILNWEGFMVRLVRLHQWLNFPSARNTSNLDSEASPLIDRPTVLIIAQNNDLVGIQVDRYWQEEEVTIRQVEGNLALPPGFTGCTILGDGRVVPLVDPLALLNWIENDGYIPASPSLPRPSVGNSTGSLIGELPSTTIPQKNTVMVVDDSINVRRFLAMTLEKANYRVEQAKDGQDALEKLQAGIAVQAIICDIEMPRLDGYGFLSRAKSDAVYKNIPVIMLTSRSGDKHRRLAMNLGANAYFSKPFKEKKLLETLSELIE